MMGCVRRRVLVEIIRLISLFPCFYLERFINTTIQKSSSRVASIIAASIVVLAWSGLATTAQAAESGDALTRTVAFGELDLNTVEGANTLYSRLQGAAAFVCSPLDKPDLRERELWRACYKQALASAVVQVGNVKVTAIYDATKQSKRVG
jgi:UrcA family protein